MVANLIVSSVLLFYGKGFGPSLQEEEASENGALSFPVDFERANSQFLHAYFPLYIISLTIGLIGTICVLYQVRLTHFFMLACDRGWSILWSHRTIIQIPIGLKVYSLAALLNIIFGASFSPFLVYFSRYLIDGVMVFIAEKLYRDMVSRSGNRGERLLFPLTSFPCLSVTTQEDDVLAARFRREIFLKATKEGHEVSIHTYHKCKYIKKTKHVGQKSAVGKNTTTIDLSFLLSLSLYSTSYVA